MSGKIKVEKWNAEHDGELNVTNMEKKLHKQGYHCTMYEFKRGTEFPLHTHDVTKKDSIVAGQFEFSMYEETVLLKPGDMIEVPKNTVHCARVFGSETVVFFDATK